MNKHLNIVTPAIEFINYRSTNNLLKLLNYLSDADCAIPSNVMEQLKRDASNPVIPDSSSVFFFDRSLWIGINKLNFNTSWTKLLTDDDAPEVLHEPVSEETKERISDFVLALKQEQESNLDITKKFSQPLLFFANINERLAEEGAFKSFIDETKDLGQLLTDFIVNDCDEKVIVHSPYLHDGAWEWMLPSICMAYSALIGEIDVVFKDEELNISGPIKANIIKKASSEGVALFSILFFVWGSIVDVRNSAKLNQAIDYFFANLIFINKENPFINLLGVLTAYKGEEEQPLDDFIEAIGLKLSVLNVIFSLTESHDYLRPEAYEFIFKSILDEKWELEDSEIKNLMTTTLNAVLHSWALLDNEQSEHIKNNSLYIDKIKSEDVKQSLKKSYKPGPSIDSALFLINQYNLELQDDNFLRDWIINWIVDSLNKNFCESGFPKKLKLIELRSLPNEFFIGAHPKYWESISTLAINLVSYDHFFSDGLRDSNKRYNVSERLVAGAESILDAGYVDYSLIFLGYGLLHGPLSEHDLYAQFSVRHINSFITKPDVWPRVEKCFLPFLNILLGLDKNQISLGSKLWIESIRKRFQLAELKLIHPINVAEPLHEVAQLKVPIWFDGSGVSVVKSLQDFAKILQRVNSPNKAQWRQIADQNNLKSKLHDICSNLETLAKQVFNPIYSQFVMNDQFKLAVNALSDRPLNDPGYLELGWIDFFIFNLQKNSKKSTKAYKDLLSAANHIDQSLGKIIYKIGDSSETVIKRFRTYKEIRNHLSHGNPMPAFSDSSWLFEYAMSDFDEIFQLAL
jgi:hypothetical protein